MRSWRLFLTAVAVLVLTTSAPHSVFADDLVGLMKGLLSTHDRVKAAEADLESSRRGIRTSRGGFFPELEVDADVGYQNRNNPSSPDTARPRTNYDVSVTQLLYDFGEVSSEVESARRSHDQSGAVLNSTRQQLLLDGLSAYINVYRSHRQLAFALESVENIKRQTELEDARVEQGAGFSTDVLQAKTQLAGAESRRIEAQGELRNAQSTYHSLFRTFVEDADALELPPLPEVLLPRTLNDAITVALRDNPSLAATRLAADIAEAELRRTRADEYFPRLQAVIENSIEKNVDGTLGRAVEQQARIELNFPFNLGLTSVDSVEGARSTLQAEQFRFADQRRTIEERTRIAWQNFMTARENFEVRSTQADIAEQFLELAREEREAGRRSLLDVLSGETDLINAQSDAVQAQSDMTIAAFAVLNAIGRLELSVLEP